MTLNWGWRIAIVYSLFALGTLGVVAFTLTQDVDLVRADYYEYGLKHDEQMRAEVNAHSLSTPLSIVYDAERGAVRLVFPPDHVADIQGTILMYRSTTMKQDRTVPILVDATGGQEISVRDDAKGKWTVKVDWTSRGVAYKIEQAIVE
ncbi:hypothetical protein BH10BAC6_BH10BAC6_16680 [soil metagenome]